MSHGFVGNTTDQGALIRVYACYTPPRPRLHPPCVQGPATRINVLQQSALPAIVEPPRSILIRTGQTANLSVTASGLPAPTLQWQTRPANSTGAWSNVATGTGATTAQYITAPLALADNGVQFRVVATNALGSAESTAVYGLGQRSQRGADDHDAARKPERGSGQRCRVRGERSRHGSAELSVVSATARPCPAPTARCCA